MTVNANNRTQIQARINAVTGSTTLTDLLILKKAAEGLGCDETALETQIQARLAAAGAGTSATDLLIGVKASGLAGRAQYTAPFAVNAGDVLYVDQMGGVRKAKHTCNALLSPRVMNNGIGSRASAQESMICGSYQQYTAFFKLQDGNWLLITPEWTFGGTLTVGFFVLSADFSSVLNSYTHDSTYSSSQQQYHYFLGLYQTAANTFRLYFFTPNSSGTSELVTICYMAFTYSSAGKSISVSNTGAYVWAASAPIIPKMSSMSQGDRYVPFLTGTGNANYQSYVLDMLNGTLQQITGLTSALGDMTWLQFDQYTAGNEYGIVRYSGGRKIYKASTAVLTDLPANVTSLFANNGVRMFAAGSYLINDSTGNLTLVKFDSSYATASFWSMGKVPSVTNAWQPSLVTDGLRYWVYLTNSAPICSFCWDGANAPYGFTIETEFKAQDRTALDFKGKPIINSSDVMLRLASFYANSSSQSRNAFYFFQCSEFMPHKQTPFGVCLTAAAQGAPIEVELLDGSEQSPASPSFNAIGYRHHQGVLTKLVLKDEQLNIKYGSVRNETANASRLQSSIVASQAQDKASLRGVSLGGYSVVLTSPNSEAAVSCSNQISVDNRITLFCPFGIFAYQISTDSSSDHGGGGLFRTHSPVLLCFSSNSASIFEGSL